MNGGPWSAAERLRGMKSESREKQTRDGRYLCRVRVRTGPNAAARLRSASLIAVFLIPPPPFFPSPQTRSVARVLQRATGPFHVVAWKSASAWWETVSLHNNVSKKKEKKRRRNAWHAHNNFQKSQSRWNMRETGPSPLKKTAYRGPLVGNWLVTQRRVIGV